MECFALNYLVDSELTANSKTSKDQTKVNGKLAENSFRMALKKAGNVSQSHEIDYSQTDGTTPSNAGLKANPLPRM